MNTLKKVFFSIFLLVFLMGTFSSSAHAQSMQSIIDAAGPDQAISSEKLAVKYNMPNMLAAMGVAITGGETTNGDVISTGAIPQVGKYIAYLSTTPPVQTKTYIADILQNTGLAQPAYAQGVGFSALTPILKVWKAFRNISYFFVIVIFIVIGFMIMLRKQIDHGTVITIQMALPKIIATLILITLSYAIVGIIVDLIYLTIFIATEAFSTFGIIENPSITREILLSQNILKVGWSYLIGSGELAGGASQSVSSMITGALGAEWLHGFTNILTYLVIAVAIIIALFRTLFTLIGSYVSIIVSTIFAPIQLLANAFPGSNTFSGWIKGVVANAAVFPAVVIMIIIGASLTGVNNPSNDSLGIEISPGVGWNGQDVGWVPPLIGSNSSNDLGLQGVQGIIGLGIIMLLPEVAGMIKKAMGVESEIGQMALAGFKSGYEKGPIGIAGGVAKSAGSYLTQFASLDALSKTSQATGIAKNWVKTNVDRAKLHITNPRHDGVSTPELATDIIEEDKMDTD